MIKCFTYVVLAIVLVAFVRPTNADDIQGVDLPLYYDARTGNVTIDITEVDSASVGYQLAIPGRLAFPLHNTPVPLFLKENWTPFMGAFVTQEEDLLGESNFSGIAPGVYSLGNILPAGLTEDEMLQFFGPVIPPPPPQPFQRFVFGDLGSQTFHVLSPQYGPSPFPALNDSSVGPTIDSWATEMDLTYNPGTGELGIDVSDENGGYFSAYFIELTDDVVAIEEHTPISDFATSTPNVISEISFVPIPGGEYSLGNVLPTGLGMEELNLLIHEAIFIGEPSHRGNPIDVDVDGLSMGIAIVPEPSNLIVIGAPMFLAFARRQFGIRRKQQRRRRKQSLNTLHLYSAECW